MEKHNIFDHTRERELEKHGIFNHTQERELEKHSIFNHAQEREQQQRQQQQPTTNNNNKKKKKNNNNNKNKNKNNNNHNNNHNNDDDDNDNDNDKNKNEQVGLIIHLYGVVTGRAFSDKWWHVMTLVKAMSEFLESYTKKMQKMRKNTRLRQYVYVAPACSITGALQDHPGKVPLFVSDGSRKLPASNRRIIPRHDAMKRPQGWPVIRRSETKAWPMIQLDTSG